MKRGWRGWSWGVGVHVMLIALLVAVAGLLLHLLQTEWRARRDHWWTARISRVVSRRVETAVQERMDLVRFLASPEIDLSQRRRILEVCAVVMTDMLSVDVLSGPDRKRTRLWARNPNTSQPLADDLDAAESMSPSGVGARLTSNGLLRVTAEFSGDDGASLLSVSFSALRLLSENAPVQEGRFTTQWKTERDLAVLTVGDAARITQQPGIVWERVKLNDQDTQLTVVPSGIEEEAWRHLHAINLLLLAGLAVVFFLVYTDTLRMHSLAPRTHEADLRRVVGFSIDRIEDERRRQSSFLHDEIGHGLTMVKLMLETQGAEFVQTPEGVRVQERLDSLLAEIRSTAARLRPHLIRDIGWGKAVAHLAREIGATAGLDVELDIDDGPLPLHYSAQEELYQVVREALTNVAKHAEATSVRIRARVQRGALALTISDNGKGIQDRGQGGFGMLGMRERVERMDGSWKVDSLSGRGTTIRIRLRQKSIPE